MEAFPNNARSPAVSESDFFIEKLPLPKAFSLQTSGARTPDCILRVERQHLEEQDCSLFGGPKGTYETESKMATSSSAKHRWMNTKSEKALNHGGAEFLAPRFPCVRSCGRVWSLPNPPRSCPDPRRSRPDSQEQRMGQEGQVPPEQSTCGVTCTPLQLMVTMLKGSKEDQ